MAAYKIFNSMNRFIYALAVSAFTLITRTANAQVFDERTGLTICYTIDAETFPETWRTDEIDAKGVALDEAELNRTLHVIKKALDKYPKDLIIKNLRKIYLLKSIEFYGQEFGGTNSYDVVYVANDGEAQGHTDSFIEQTFHQEFSSILLRNYPHILDSEKWMGINGIPYGAGGVQALKDSGDAMDFEPTLHSQGFLYQYAISSLENDFNSFAENIFCPLKGFHEALLKYPKLKQKYNMVLQFYNTLDKTLTRDYFESLSSRIE